MLIATLSQCGWS